ncbi:unnamed protein product [Gongylonema pulchrum]|uniref:MoCF_biosynth domain-containing protein n=1 Tax=Gongylonema pulchrum TaxID=637853 RepID=A0A183DX66_9BILA|nr:unnamed protein product [Gongylonema pulchrum]
MLPNAAAGYIPIPDPYSHIWQVSEARYVVLRLTDQLRTDLDLQECSAFVRLKGECISSPISDVIISTGGTGFSARDVTPEATLNVIKKRCGGMEVALHMRSLAATSLAALSRLCVGIRDSTLIINLPGNPKAVKECFEVLEETLPHAMDILSDKKDSIKDCHFSLTTDEKLNDGDSGRRHS